MSNLPMAGKPMPEEVVRVLLDAVVEFTTTGAIIIGKREVYYRPDDGFVVEGEDGRTYSGMDIGQALAFILDQKPRMPEGWDY